MIRKVVLTVVVILIVGVAGVVVYLLVTTPSLPAGSREVISQVLASEVPELVTGETGYADSSGVQIWYESIEPAGEAKGTVLLMMGIGGDALGWPRRFLQELVDAGYRVVRYDHRGTGMSDWLEDWDPDDPYTFHDMADDAAAILDTLGADAAHVVGVSMGGMIGQQFVIDHPDRALTLTSIMSSCDINDPDLPPISAAMAQELIKVSARYGLLGTERSTINMYVASHVLLRGDAAYEIDVQSTAEMVLYNLRMRRGYNPRVSQQHQAAGIISGSRYFPLGRISQPTLLIHGKADPFIPIEHGQKCAEVMPHADTFWVEGLSHDLPDAFIDIIVEKIVAHLQTTSAE